MKRVKKYMLGLLAASFFFYIPFTKKWRYLWFSNDDQNDDKNNRKEIRSSLKVISFKSAIENDKRTEYASTLMGKSVLFHKMTDHNEFAFQNYAFAGNVVSVYHDVDNKKRYDVKLFMSNTELCLSELGKVIRKDITKDLIIKGFVRSELSLA